MKVIEALEQNASFDGPAGKTTIDPQTHHTILDVYIGEARDKKILVLEKFRSRSRPTRRPSATSRRTPTRTSSTSSTSRLDGAAQSRPHISERTAVLQTPSYRAVLDKDAGL
jgi:ABC-type branched-chain amino acid transport systems, periplasmic component